MKGWSLEAFFIDNSVGCVFFSEKLFTGRFVARSLRTCCSVIRRAQDGFSPPQSLSPPIFFGGDCSFRMAFGRRGDAPLPSSPGPEDDRFGEAEQDIEAEQPDQDVGWPGAPPEIEALGDGDEQQ